MRLKRQIDREEEDKKERERKSGGRTKTELGARESQVMVKPWDESDEKKKLGSTGGTQET